MNNADRQRNLPLFERGVLAVAKPLIRSATVLAAWQFRCAERPRYHFAAALGLRAIDLAAGALGAVVWARHWFVSDAKISERFELQGRAVEAREPAHLVHKALSELAR